MGNIHNVSWMVARKNGSSTWRSVALGIREVVSKGHSWVMGNGREIKFWTDRWLSNQPLTAVTVAELLEGYEDITARDMWVVGGSWDLTQIAPFVTDETRLELAGVVVDTVMEGEDRLAWGHTNNGQFTVKSAHDLITHDDTPRPYMGEFFRGMWHVVALERVRIFLWLVGQQAIMTNAERYRRHLSGTDVCQVCKGEIETILHVLRDCPAMSGIWERLVPAVKRYSFFSKPLLEWLYENLRENGVGRGVLWSTSFALAIWWGWKWRCCNVFGENRLWRDRVGFLRNLSKEVMVANDIERGRGNMRNRTEILVRWTTPLEGWMKMNTDGASYGTRGQLLREE